MRTIARDSIIKHPRRLATSDDLLFYKRCADRIYAERSSPLPQKDYLIDSSVRGRALQDAWS